MNVKLTRQYASRMASVFSDKVCDAKRKGLSEDSLKYLEDRRNFWGKVAQLHPDSEHWEFVMSYLLLMSDPKASKTRIRALYRFLQEAMKLNQSASKQAEATLVTRRR